MPQEDLNRGKPNWEHLNDELHVLITVEDTRSRAEMKLRRAVDEINKLLIPAVSIFYFERSNYICNDIVFLIKQIDNWFT